MRRSIVMLVTAHPHYPEIGAGDNGEPIGYFISSRAFREKFGNITPDAAFALIKRRATHKKKGPVFDATEVIGNSIGEAC